MLRLPPIPPRPLLSESRLVCLCLASQLRSLGVHIAWGGGSMTRQCGGRLCVVSALGALGGVCLANPVEQVSIGPAPSVRG